METPNFSLGKAFPSANLVDKGDGSEINTCTK